MGEARYIEIDKYRIENDALPDGAFFCKAEEQGITAEDWAEWADEHQRRERQAKERK